MLVSMSPSITYTRTSEARNVRLPVPAVVLFDWHGTLVNTQGAMYRAIADLLPQLDSLDLVRHLLPESQCKTPEDAKLVRYIRIFRRVRPRILAERRVSRTDIFDAIFGDDEEAKRIAHAAYDECYRRHFGKVFPLEAGVRAHLATLAGLGIELGIATNRKREYLDAELHTLGWDDLVPISVSGDEVPKRKPAPDVIFAALDRLGVKASEHVWFVGDSLADVATARAAGVTAVFYNGALWDEPFLDRMLAGEMAEAAHHAPDALVDDFDSLLDLVARADEGLAERIAASRPPRGPMRTRPEPHVEPDWHPAVVHLTKPTIILFDWHATLVDTLDAMYRAVDDTLPELYELGLMERMVAPEDSRSIEDKRLVEYVRSARQLHPKIKADRKISRTDIFEVLFGEDEDAKRIAHATFNKHYGRYFGAVQPFEPEVKDVLRALRTIPLKVGVITNRDREFFAQELETVGWGELFDTSVCGDDTVRRKPHPDQVAQAVKNLGGKLGPHVWYVGDSTTDTIAAKTAGITSVFFNGAQWDQTWLNKIFPGTPKHPFKPDVVVNDFSEFFAMTLACLGKG